MSKKTPSPIPRGDKLQLAYLYGGSMSYQPGERLALRTLTDFELVVIFEGHPVYEANGERYSLQPGAVILSRPGFRECYDWDREGNTRHAFFHFGIEKIPRTWSEPDDWPVMHHSMNETIEALFRAVLQRCQQRGGLISESPSRVETQLVETLLELLLEDSESHPESDESVRPAPVARALKWMRHVLEEEPHRQGSLEEVASKAGVSPEHLCRLFSQSMGHSPMETLRLLRLQLGLALLIRSSLAVKEIAEHCGFADPLYFSRCFSRVFGCSPRHMREKVKSGNAPPRPPLPVDVTPRVHW